MTETTGKQVTRGDWRFSAALGLSIGLGLGAARAIEEGFEPTLGFVAAGALSLLTAATVGGLSALLVYGLFRRPPGEVNG